MSLNTIEIIFKKREGYSLSKEEIEFLIQGYVQGEIPDYQMAAWAMAVFFQGLTPKETANLTTSMARSGTMLDFNSLGFVLDKHSTGGVGDTTTLIVLPLVALAGGKIAKLSGRGLGHTGGTIDKLEAIPGFKTELTEEEIFWQVKNLGLAIAGQTKNLVPADKMLYALRDVTATVDSLPLIAASIMSKKIAGGAQGIVLDVKVGRGAFTRDLESAKELAELMVDLGRQVGLKVTAVISDMEVPLSRAQGNSLEVLEAVNVLQGKGSRRLRELSLVLAKEMLALDNKKANLAKSLENGSALNMFNKLVTFQGGNLQSLQVKALYKRELFAEKSGYFSAADALKIGEIVRDLGAGRKVKGARVNPDVGIYFTLDLGDKINQGDVLATVYANNEAALEEAVEKLSEAVKIGPRPYNRPVVLDIIRSEAKL